MSDLSTKHLDFIRNKFGPELAEALRGHQDAINNGFRQVNAAPVGRIPPPPAHTALSVTGGAGLLDIKVADASPAYPGYERFADVSNDGFATSKTIHMGATTSWRGASPLSGKVNVRTYSQYPTSDISPHLYHSTEVDTSSSEPAKVQAGDTLSGYGSQAVGNIKR